jgi:hypothetical protein
MIGVNFKQVAFSQKYAAYLQSVRWRWVPGVASGVHPIRCFLTKTPTLRIAN